MGKKLNDKMQQILDFVNRHVEEKGYPPSVREICAETGFKSTSTVHGYLEKLTAKGLILKDPTKPRALKVLNGGKKAEPKVNEPKEYYPGREMVEIPIIGKVSAGLPILAEENIEDTFPLPLDFVRNSEAFMLRIQGDSMVEAGILNHDLVLVKKQNIAVNGEIVVALIGDEATCKTFYREKDHIRLQPQNPQYDPIIVRENLNILGKVIGVFRMIR